MITYDFADINVGHFYFRLFNCSFTDIRDFVRCFALPNGVVTHFDISVFCGSEVCCVFNFEKFPTQDIIERIGILDDEGSACVKWSDWLPCSVRKS